MKGVFSVLIISILVILPQEEGYSQKLNPPKWSLAKADSLFFIGDWRAAKEMYDQVLKDTPTNGVALARCGMSSLNLKMYNDAQPLLAKALTFQLPGPVRMNTFVSMARVLSVKNNKIKAIQSLDSAIHLGYFNLGILDTNQDFANVRNEPAFKVLRQHVYEVNYPCMANLKAREFDFWIGDWEVYVTGTQTYAGHNKIEMVSGGCALLENWKSNASEGKSLNFIDPISSMWKQTWVGSYPSGIQEFVQGSYKDGAMRFIFESTDAQGNKLMGRFIFYNEKPGQVRQFNETSADGGKTWITSYDYTYFRK